MVVNLLYPDPINISSNIQFEAIEFLYVILVNLRNHELLMHLKAVLEPAREFGIKVKYLVWNVPDHSSLFFRQSRGSTSFP